MHGTAQHNKQINTSLGVLSCLVCGFILKTYFNDNMPVILVNHFDLIIKEEKEKAENPKGKRHKENDGFNIHSYYYYTFKMTNGKNAWYVDNHCTFSTSRVAIYC